MLLDQGWFGIISFELNCHGNNAFRVTFIWKVCFQTRVTWNVHCLIKGVLGIMLLDQGWFGIIFVELN